MYEPKSIAFAGDWHRNGFWARQAIKYAAEHGADTIVQAGDFAFDFSSNFLHGVRHALGEFGVQLYFVDGNHDDLTAIEDRFEPDEDGFLIPRVGTYRERLHYIPRGHRWQWWDLTFMGLGGAHSVDRPWREPGISWWATELITEADLRRATQPEGEPVDVMITHDLFEDAPFPNDRKDTGWPEAELRMARGNRLAVQFVVDRVKPKLFVHGHYHTKYERKHEGIKIVGLGMDATSMAENLWIPTREELLI